MKFPENLAGPQFADGDLVSFIFDEAELSLRLPRVPHNTRAVDSVNPQRDFRNADTSTWESLGDEGHCITRLSLQNWKYEDTASHDNIALAHLKIEVLKHSDKEAGSCFALNSESFIQDFITGIRQEFGADAQDERPYWPTKQNNFFAKIVKHGHIDGLQVQLMLNPSKQYPVPCAYFSLGRRYSLRITFHFDPLHYPDRTNPYNEELLHQFKLDVFDNFLSHLRIEYTPETRALIDELRTQQP
jgi:hypothetical protein